MAPVAFPPLSNKEALCVWHSGNTVRPRGRQTDLPVPDRARAADRPGRGGQCSARPRSPGLASLSRSLARSLRSSHLSVCCGEAANGGMCEFTHKHKHADRLWGTCSLACHLHTNLHNARSPACTLTHAKNRIIDAHMLPVTIQMKSSEGFQRLFILTFPLQHMQNI